MLFSCIETPIGKCAIVFKGEHNRAKVVHIFLPTDSIEKRIHEIYPEVIQGEHQKITQLEDEISEYFRGKKKRISMSLLDTSLCSPFQLKVLKTERTIPYGKAASYSWVGGKIGTRAYRAVGSALARNPFPIIIPCHRAIRSDRTLGGFQGGIEMKRKLLEMEGVRFDSKGRVGQDFFLK